MKHICTACYLLIFYIVSSAIPASAEAFFGVLNLIWSGDGPSPTQTIVYALDTLDLTGNVNGSEYLEFDVVEDFGSLLRLNREEVTVIGERDPDTGLVVVDDIFQDFDDVPQRRLNRRLGDHPPSPSRWLTILCRFGDSTGTTPATTAYFTGLMNKMDEYWQEASYGAMTLTNTNVDWGNMPNNRADYLSAITGKPLFDDLVRDCVDLADSTIDFSADPPFNGINLMFNGALNGVSWGGSRTLTRDGVTRTYGITWMADHNWDDHDYLAHEIGHAFSLPHSSGMYGATYDSGWDVMSKAWYCSAADSDPDYKCLAVHPIGFHKDLLGWIDDTLRYEADASANQVVRLDRLALPTGDAGKMLTVQIPILGTGDDYYYVDCRQKVGSYDLTIPLEGVNIHRVDTTRTKPAQVVDVDAVADTDPNDDGAQWLPGELFQGEDGVSVGVLTSATTGCDIVINPTVADLSATVVETPNPNLAGEQLLYTFTVLNNGPETATSVLLSVTLPSSVNFISASPECTALAGNVVECSMGSLAAATPVNFAITVDVPADLSDAELCIDTTVSSEAYDIDPSNDSISQCAPLIPANSPPECASAYASPDTLYPADKEMKDISIEGVTDPDGDPIELTVTSIFQDEPRDSEPTATGVGTSTPRVKAGRKGMHNGRVYHISFEAKDDDSALCDGEVTVCVPYGKGSMSMSKPKARHRHRNLRRGEARMPEKKQKKMMMTKPPLDLTCVDEGALYDST